MTTRSPLLRFPSATVFVGLLLVAGAASASVNKSLRVRDGERSRGGLSSVNGGVTVGRGATVDGDVQTVNGGIRIDDDARTRDVSSVNGSIRIGANVVIDGDVEAVNGPIDIEPGSSVEGDVETVNGGIELDGTTVAGHVATLNGRIRLDRGTRVKGDLIVEDQRRNRWHREKVLEIVLAGESVVEGNLEVRDPRREVRVILRDGSAVRGRIEGAEVVRE